MGGVRYLLVAEREEKLSNGTTDCRRYLQYSSPMRFWVVRVALPSWLPSLDFSVGRAAPNSTRRVLPGTRNDDTEINGERMAQQATVSNTLRGIQNEVDGELASAGNEEASRRVALGLTWEE